MSGKPDKAALSALAEQTGYSFKDPSLLIQALTHSSAQISPDNQRLEFLGDRALGMTIADALFTTYPNEAEGELALRYNDLVNKQTCADIAEKLNLGDLMRLSRSEAFSGGRKKLAILGDGMEAYLGAVYLDGKYEAAQACIMLLWGDLIKNQKQQSLRDPKSELQEWAQARKLPPPSYTVISRDGPDHAPEFIVEASLKTGENARAKALSKREAQKLAATELLGILRPINNDQ